MMPEEQVWKTLAEACQPIDEGKTFECQASALAVAFDSLVNLAHDKLELQARIDAAMKADAIKAYEHQEELGKWWRQWPIVGTVGLVLGLGVGCAVGFSK